MNHSIKSSFLMPSGAIITGAYLTYSYGGMETVKRLDSFTAAEEGERAPDVVLPDPLLALAGEVANETLQVLLAWMRAGAEASVGSHASNLSDAERAALMVLMVAEGAIHG